jgi:hypothetical protein
MALKGAKIVAVGAAVEALRDAVNCLRNGEARNYLEHRLG